MCSTISASFGNCGQKMKAACGPRFSFDCWVWCGYHAACWVLHFNVRP